MSQYYESSKYISNLFFVMRYTYILDDSIKSLTLILTADHSTFLFLPGFFFFFFYKIKNFLFLLWVNLYMITDTYLHGPPRLNRSFVFYVAGHLNAHNDITLCIGITPGLQHRYIPSLPHTLGLPSPLYFFFDGKHLM